MHKNLLIRRALAALLAVGLMVVYAGCGQATAELAPEPAPVDADVNVEAIPDLSADFMMGVDISSLPAELASGVVYRDFDGNAITDIAGFCGLLAQAGVTHVRVRVWNDPYDAEGHGYGGGNNDVDAAVAIAQGCAAAGLKLLVDFHCSDFWADPSKQMAPKAWEGMSLDEKAAALNAFVADSLAAIAATGVDVDMVQIGNETNSAFAGERGDEAMCTLFKAGIEAVHAAGARAVIHVTDPNKGTMAQWAETLKAQGVDYDILATSYYPAYHGTLQQLTEQLSLVRETYGKDVLVVESSYPYTTDDTDSGGQTVLEGEDLNWPFTPQGQATYLRELIAAANAGGALGFFYWEPAWITVGDMTGLEGAALDTQLAANQALWEEFGSGWAASYAGSYDPDDAGVWYGGSAMDNQAMFDPAGDPLPSLRIWQYVRTGAATEQVTVEQIAPITVEAAVGGALEMPESVDVTYNSGIQPCPVSWDADELAAVDLSVAGEYSVHGTVHLDRDTSDGTTEGEAVATVRVTAGNLIPDAAAASFETPDGFVMEGEGLFDLPDGETPYEGESCLHWWHEDAQVSSVTYQGPIELSAGSYVASVMAQGMTGDKVRLEVLDAEGAVLASGEPATMADWKNWQQPQVAFTLEGDTAVQLRVVIEMQAGGWGTCDCLCITPAP